MLTKPSFAVVELTDKVMGVNIENFPDILDHYKDHLKLISDIRFKFSLGVFACEYYGSNGKQNSAFSMKTSDCKTSNNFFWVFINASENASTYLSHCEINIAIDTLAQARMQGFA